MPHEIVLLSYPLLLTWEEVAERIFMGVYLGDKGRPAKKEIFFRKGMHVRQV